MVNFVVKKIIVSVCVLMLFNPVANASQCTVNFRHYFVTNTGTLAFYLNRSGHWWYLCSLEAEINGVSIQSCKSAMTSFLTSKAMNKPLTFTWPGTCDELTSPTQSIAGRGFTWLGVYDL